MQVRQLSPHTQRAYIANVARFARHFGRSPAELGPEEIRTYQLYLTTERHLGPSSLVVAVSALRFLYRVTLTRPWSCDVVIPIPKRTRPLPVVLSPAEVVQCWISRRSAGVTCEPRPSFRRGAFTTGEGVSFITP